MLLFAPPASAEVALEAAAACFDAVDYDCAEERLAAVWGGGGLETDAALRARLLEAQLALARRDEPRARKAVRAVFSLDPEFTADERLPPRLRALFDEERPPAPPLFRLAGRAGLTSWRLFGHDAERWSDGLGFEAGLGGVLRDRWGLEAGVAFSDHRPRTYELSGLSLWSAFVGGRAHLDAGFLTVAPGVTLGALHVGAEGVTGSEAYWGFQGQTTVDVAAEVWAGFGIGARVGVMVVAVADGDDRAAFSWVLPLEVGVRYGY
ncbi:hypothetical protein L6V77_20305 [Myxococcota bacterium]|nr:hypothetical protein [Myxococcota bacterium]